MLRSNTGLIAIAITIAAPAAGGASEYCVTCSAPDAVYRCQLEGDMPGRRDAGAQLLCITELAKAGGHASCSARRVESGPCEGPPRIVARPAGNPPPDLPPEGEAPPDERLAAETVPPDTMPPDNEPKPALPKTVEAFASETAKSSGEGLKKAGDVVTGTAKAAGEKIEQAGGAVAGAAKKTWSCLSSLFTNCK